MLETAICKLFCSEGLWQIADDALQIWGGEGYMREHGIERMLRDARINRIVEGATEVMTAFVALVGMKGVGEEFESVLRVGQAPGRQLRPAGAVRAGPVARRRHRRSARRPTACTRELQEEGDDAGRADDAAGPRGAQAAADLPRRTSWTCSCSRSGSRWSVVDMYAMAAVISRLQSMLEAAGDHGKATATATRTATATANGNGNGHAHADPRAGEGPDHRQGLLPPRARPTSASAWTACSATRTSRPSRSRDAMLSSRKRINRRQSSRGAAKNAAHGAGRG